MGKKRYWEQKRTKPIHLVAGWSYEFKDVEPTPLPAGVGWEDVFKPCLVDAEDDLENPTTEIGRLLARVRRDPAGFLKTHEGRDPIRFAGFQVPPEGMTWRAWVRAVVTRQMENKREQLKIKAEEARRRHGARRSDRR